MHVSITLLLLYEVSYRLYAYELQLLGHDGGRFQPLSSTLGDLLTTTETEPIA